MFTLPETITVWNKASTDGFGEITWDGPFNYPARIAYKQEQFRDRQGKITLSKAVIYTRGEEIEIGSTVYLGESSNIVPIDGSNEIEAFSTTPSGPGDLKKVWI